MAINHNVSARLNISRIPAFSDNYLWLLDNSQSAIAIDPGEAQAIIDQVETSQLNLDYILITHHHPDHTGGIAELQSRYQAEVIGPDSQYIPQVTRHVGGGDQITLLGRCIDVIAVPGHTLDHIAYFIATHEPLDSPLLFCGDALFAGGCGRLFEGSAAQMRASLAKLRQLPNDTRIHCAHEYTQANLAFAAAVEPGNPALMERIAKVTQLRANDQATVPSLLSDELATNPFLRYDNDNVIAAASKYSQQQMLNADQVFSTIRQWKDSF